MKPILVKRIEAFFAAQRLQGGSGVVAISGGPDSVSLAWALVQLLRGGFFRSLVLAHLNHQLRGPDSDADEAFVIDLAQRWEVPVVTRRIDIAFEAQQQNLEDTARRVRYGFLAEVARTRAAGWIATGHTANDQAETVLHHLLRGSGLAGWSGIAPCRTLENISLVRPLLTSTREEVLAFAQEENLPFQIDASNADRTFTRNKIRHELLPLLARDYNPAVIDILSRAGAQAAECQAAITEEAGRLLNRCELPRAGEMVVLSRERLREHSPFWVREVFRLIWQREQWPTGAMTFDDWNRSSALVADQLPRHDFPGGVYARSVLHVIQLWRS